VFAERQTAEITAVLISKYAVHQLKQWDTVAKFQYSQLFRCSVREGVEV
jgi:hypothetical protein